MAQTQPLSRRDVVLFALGLIYVCVVETLWSRAVNHYHILEHYRWLIPVSLWWWAIILIPLTITTAVMRIPFRRAFVALAAFVFIELLVWEGNILFHIIKAFGVRQALMMESQTSIFEALFGVILGSISLAIQLAVFLVVRKLAAVLKR
jgi:hypothetical protein